MPVLESTDLVMPRSALRYRSIRDDAAKPGSTPVAARASRLRPKHTEEDEAVSAWKGAAEDDDEAMPGSASPAPRPRSPLTRHPHKAARMARMGVKRQGILGRHPLFYLGIGMIAMLVLWTFLLMAISWWNTTWDDLHFGRPRTFQTDAIVGHHDSPGNFCHFIAVNLNGRIEIIEFPGGDASKARIYLGPQLYGSGEDLVPVTLSFVDVNGNHLPDMIVHVQNTQMVFINDQGGFRLASPDELHEVESYLRQH